MNFEKVFFAPNHGGALIQSYIKSGGGKIWLHKTLIILIFLEINAYVHNKDFDDLHRFYPDILGGFFCGVVIRNGRFLVQNPLGVWPGLGFPVTLRLK